MLNQLSNPKAKKLIERKEYVAFYVPLRLEAISKADDPKLAIDKKICWFRFLFNSILAGSIIVELTALLKDLFPNALDRANAEYSLAKSIHHRWMAKSDQSIYQLSELREAVNDLFYRVDPLTNDLSDIPKTFTHSLGSSLSSISSILYEKLGISPTWIVCVDEAEFLEECYQKCLNTVIRSDTDRIVFKISTLPFHHTTRYTLDEHNAVLHGHDFKYTSIDMDYESPDFINVTNALIKTRLNREDIQQLEDFAETVGDDDVYVNYYAKAFNLSLSPEDLKKHVVKQIFSQLTEDKQKAIQKAIQKKIVEDGDNKNYSESELTEFFERYKEIVEDGDNKNQKALILMYDAPVFRKFAPIFYLREMRKKAKGHTYVGWFAGAAMIRRVSQGNPRTFIRIMYKFFNAIKGKRPPLPVKTQCHLIRDFAKAFCKETERLPFSGHKAKENIERISDQIYADVHKNGLKDSGVSFKLTDISACNENKWIDNSIAYSRLVIDSDSLSNQNLTADSTFELVNAYAVQNWLHMRKKNNPPIINLKNKSKKKPARSRNKSERTLLSFSKKEK
jgi:hypothetical protein